MSLKNIYEITRKMKIKDEFVEPYGHFKAKLSIPDQELRPHNGKLVLVTAITPTRAGEGKTTTSIALSDGLCKIGKQSLLCLREPSLGPVFGIKGGATGGGLASIGPKDEIDLHFTGDMHALTSSINLISAIIDNHIFQGNELNIDPTKVVWKRALDMNDRTLRNIIIGIGEKNGVERSDSFLITVASELMAILCLANNEDDFIAKSDRIIVAYTSNMEPVRLQELGISNAIRKLMKDALKPNIVQTLENNPCLIHGGPFANIAHGCNSIIATKLGLKLSDIVVTEAGFGADLGAEKFLDIKAQEANLNVDACVMVATIRALKMHGGQSLECITDENLEALNKGVCNLKIHLENIAKYGVPVVVAINHFSTDHENEVKLLEEWCIKNGYVVSFLDGFIKGSEGSIDLANKVVNVLENTQSKYKPIYTRDMTISKKITAICKDIYRANEIVILPKAQEQIEFYESLGFDNAYICMAKTPQSLSDDPSIIGAPIGTTITIREVTLSAGANFLVCLTGDIMTMPGLPKVPAAMKM